MGIYFSHPASSRHDTGDHPERGLRLATLEAELAARDWPGWERVQSPPVDLAVLELVHPRRHIESVAALSARAASLGARVALDADTVVSAGSYEAALRAAGGAVEMVRRLVAAGQAYGNAGHSQQNDAFEVPVGFSAHRPPGHHAPADRAMGFCLFNNIAVAARYAVDVLGLARVAIVDWDVHHGNGTQEIFWGSDEVLFCSLHQMPLYPGSGYEHEVGAGPGEGFTLNLPVRPGAGDSVWVPLVRDVVVPRVREFAPQLVLVSAGYDAHAQDPLAGCAVSDAGFAAMAAAVRGIADEFQVPLGLVLEGGYAPAALARSVLATMEAVG